MLEEIPSDYGTTTNRSGLMNFSTRPAWFTTTSSSFVAIGGSSP